MTTTHDVLRYLIRSNGHASGAVEQDLLLTVDADEQGYADLESYKEALDQKKREEAASAQAAAAGPQVPADQTAGLTDEQLEAEMERRKALQAAHSGNRPTLTGQPIPTTVNPTPVP